MTNYRAFGANDLHRLAHQAVGFDRFFDTFETLVADKSTFPHHNIIKTGQETYLIELAIAGFTEDDVIIELEKGILNIKGSKEEQTDPDFEYLHRGIATRAFHKTIRLADTIEVESAFLENGILRIVLVNIVPEEKKPKKIPITQIGKKQLLNE